MKEGDEWKAEIQTNQGLFELLVMFFGLCNSPATVRATAERLSRDLARDPKYI